MKNKHKIISWFTTFKHKHIRLSTLLMMLLINIGIILVFTLILSLLSHQPFATIIRYAVITSFSSDTIFEMEQIFASDAIYLFIVLVVLILIEMIMFTGAILGFTTSVLSDMFDERARLKGHLSLYDHYVILNWSDIGPDIIYDLSNHEGKYTIVILSERPQEEVENAIDSLFVLNKRKNKNLNILIREGNPFSMKNLEDISVATAHSVAILSSQVNSIIEGDLTSSDLKALKLLLTVAQSATDECNIVVEAETKLAVDKLKKLIKVTECLQNKEISIFSFNCVLGLIMGNILINPYYSLLYDELLSFEGKEFYTIPAQNIDEYLKYHNNAIPIINYDDNRNGTLDQLYVMSENYQQVVDKQYIRKEPYQTERKLKLVNNPEDYTDTIYIVGASNKKQFIKDNIENFNKKNHSHIQIKLFDKVDILAVARLLLTEPGKKKLLILSNELYGNDNRDANVYMDLLNIKEHVNEFKDIEIYSEVLDPVNYDSVQSFAIDGVVISNRLVSLLLVQLFTHDNGANFYEDFISVDTDDNKGLFDFEIVKAKEILDLNQDLHFNSFAEIVNSFYYSSDKKMMIIGLIEDNKQITFLSDEMDKPRNIIIKETTQLVVVKY